MQQILFMVKLAQDSSKPEPQWLSIQGTWITVFWFSEAGKTQLFDPWLTAPMFALYWVNEH